MGNTMGRKRKMGSSTSQKWLGPDAQAKKDGLTPLGRSYSMPVHHAKPKADNYHVVALTSSTYGILKVDLPKDVEESRTSLSQNRAIEVTGQANVHDRMRKFDIPAVVVPTPWSEMEQALPKHKPVKDGRVDGSETLKTVDEESTVEPETINMWELMEGLDEDARSPSPLYLSPSPVSAKPVQPKRGRLETSLSFSSIHTITEVDAEYLEGAIKSELKSAVENDTLIKGKCYTVSPSTGRHAAHLSSRPGSGKENAASVPAFQRETAVSTLTPAKLNSSVAPSAASGDSKLGSSLKSPGAVSNTPSKAGGTVVAVVAALESKALARSNGLQELSSPKLPFGLRTKVGSPNSPLPPLPIASPRVVSRSVLSPQVSKQSRSENAYASPFSFTTSSSEDSDDRRPLESPLFDPEFLASFELSEDEWYRVRRSEAGVASTSGSSSDGDSPLRQAEHNSNIALEASPLARKPEIDTNSRKMSFSKVAPVDFRDVVLQKVMRKVDPFEKFDKKCPPGGEDRVVVYVTSLRGIRKTFEDCSHMKLVIQGYRVAIDERDVSMHADFRQELKDLLGKPMPVPRLFIRGHYIGGAEEVSLLHEDGTLSKLLETMPTQTSWEQCEGCGDHRFVPCSECSGSCKVVTEDDEVVRCTECNENGLIRCPICF